MDYPQFIDIMLQLGSLQTWKMMINHETSENPSCGSEIHRCTGSIESLIGQIAEFGALDPNQKSFWTDG
jgi:hypothetical protein